MFLGRASSHGQRTPTAGKTGLNSYPKRERIVHDLAEAKNCYVDAIRPRHMGEEISKCYEYILAEIVVIEDASQKYDACTVGTATKTAEPIEKGEVGASVLRYVHQGSC
jgi:hypothetical protein